jgi:4'-phosphopantetheinyl transferase EntD
VTAGSRRQLGADTAEGLAAWRSNAVLPPSRPLAPPMQLTSAVHIVLDRLDASCPGRPVLALTSAGEERTAARLAARAAVACAARQPIGSVVIESRSGSAPAVSLPAGAAPFRVSVSHRDGHAAAAAVTAALHIGVDLEAAEAVSEKSARHFLGETERRDGLRCHDLTTLWALKEAAWKALLLDQTVPFSGLQLHFDARGALHRLELPAARTAFRARSRVREPFPGFRLAVVVAARENQ